MHYLLQEQDVQTMTAASDDVTKVVSLAKLIADIVGFDSESYVLSDTYSGSGVPYI